MHYRIFHIRNAGFYSGYFILLLLLGVSCKKANESVQLEDGVSVVITDLAGDTSASMAGGGAGFKALYFSFGSGTAVSIAETDKPTLKWDLAFTGPYNSEVYVNDGSYEFNPGFGGPGRGAVVIVEKPYDEVVEAPSEEAFNSSEVRKIGWDSGNGQGWFFYSLSNHIMVPVKNRTFVLRTANGRYCKLQLINAYKGNPPVVTDLFWPAPYFTFKYFVQQDGSRSLKTRR